MATAAPTHPGVSPTDGSSIDAAPEGVPEHSQLALAKFKLMDAARAIQPLQPLRDHPWTTVATAAGAGAVLGGISGGGGAVVSLSALARSLAAVIRSLSSILTPLMGVIGPFVAGKVAATTTAKDDAADADAAADPASAANGDF